jgi:hypothetical protein
MAEVLDLEGAGSFGRRRIPFICHNEFGCSRPQRSLGVAPVVAVAATLSARRTLSLTSRRGLSCRRSSLYFGCMLTIFRRSRVMALAMLLLAPGIAGTGIQWLHACPTEAPPSADHQHHGSTPPQPAGHTEGCECIGSCLTAALVAPPGATILAELEPPQPRLLSFSNGFVPVRSPTHLLPPATAPPLS